MEKYYNVNDIVKCGSFTCKIVADSDTPFKVGINEIKPFFGVDVILQVIDKPDILIATPYNGIDDLIEKGSNL